MTQGPIATHADGLHEILMAWLDLGMDFFNNAIRKREYRRIFEWLEENRDRRIFSYRYDGGTTGYIRNPKGVLIAERWRAYPDSPLRQLVFASLFGLGSTP